MDSVYARDGQESPAGALHLSAVHETFRLRQTQRLVYHSFLGVVMASNHNRRKKNHALKSECGQLPPFNAN